MKGTEQENTSQKPQSILFKNEGLDTCHYRYIMIRTLRCDNTCHANGNNSEAYTVILFFKKLFWQLPFLAATFLWISFKQSEFYALQ
jgi:hypothetical protein